MMKDLFRNIINYKLIKNLVNIHINYVLKLNSFYILLIYINYSKSFAGGLHNPY